jgi:ABC-type polysaccharide/polyol phosphate export permease
MDLRTRYRGSAFGIGWSLLNPIAMTIILCVVFSTMFHQPVKDFAPYLMGGLTFWQYITTASLQGCECFFAGESYIRQHPAPMAIYPLRTVLGAAFHFLMGYSLVLAISLLFHGPGFIGLLPLLSLIPALALLLVFGWSLAVLFALANVRFRDLRHLSEVGFQALFYLTPIIYGTEQMEKLLERRTVGWLFMLNPLVPFLDILRVPVVRGETAAPHVFLAAFLITLTTLTAAVAALKSEERKLIFHL